MGQTIAQLMAAMWQDYLAMTPDAKAIHGLLAAYNGGVVINDHIALRTFNLAKVNRSKLAQPFLAAGYQPGGRYDFPARKLVAQHWQHDDSDLPKVFISELLVETLSPAACRLIESLVAQVDAHQVAQDTFCFSGRPWDLSLAEYDRLLAESEYAAWVAAHGYRPNHFTVSVNHLASHQRLEDLNQWLLDQGYTLNDRGGLIKGSPAVLLEQSATMAGKVTVRFRDGNRAIPGCFYEFAKRYPMDDGHLYQGFVAASADKIFDSTHT